LWQDHKETFATEQCLVYNVLVVIIGTTIVSLDDIEFGGIILLGIGKKIFSDLLGSIGKDSNFSDGRFTNQKRKHVLPNVASGTKDSNDGHFQCFFSIGVGGCNDCAFWNGRHGARICFLVLIHNNFVGFMISENPDERKTSRNLDREQRFVGFQARINTNRFKARVLFLGAFVLATQIQKQRLVFESSNNTRINQCY